jgi:hypothetical protein
MAVKYTKLFHSKAFQNTYTKIRILGMKISILATLIGFRKGHDQKMVQFFLKDAFLQNQS